MKIFKSAQKSKTQPSLFYDQWSEGYDIKDEQGNPRQLYHGTLAPQFDKFHTDGWVENYLGKGIYTSDNPKDVADNYATPKGGDLMDKIERIQDNLLWEIEEDPEFAKELGMTAQNIDYDKLKEIAAQRLNIQLPRTIPLYGKMKNPAYLKPNMPSTYSMLPDYEKYNEETDEYEDYSTTSDIVWDNLYELAYEYFHYDHTVDKFIDEIKNNLPEDFNIYDLNEAIRTSSHFNDLTNDAGELIGGEFVKELIQALGYDGVVMDAHHYFSNMTTPGTNHYIFFDPKQLKSSIGNSGVYDPQTPVLTAKTKIFKRPR